MAAAVVVVPVGNSAKFGSFHFFNVWICVCMGEMNYDSFINLLGYIYLNIVSEQGGHLVLQGRKKQKGPGGKTMPPEHTKKYKNRLKMEPGRPKMKPGCTTSGAKIEKNA